MRVLWLVVLLAVAVQGNAEIEQVYMRNDPASPRFGAMSSFAPFEYWGGPVISAVKIVLVRWGAGVYAPYVSQTAGAQTLASFYTELVRSPWLDWLTEYNTNTQTIGRGSFLGAYTITPSTAGSVSDDFIETELLAQIDAGHLPANDDNTLYQIHFPRGVTISAFGMLSCVDFCAYHGTVQLPTPALYYSVMPDFSSSSGCSRGCGSSSEFNNVCAVASHEVAEAITDPGVGLAFDYAPPLAWYSPVYGETADLCNGLQGSFVSANGTRYTVQTTGSNLARNCLDNCVRSAALSRSRIPANGNWFTISLSYNDRLCATSLHQNTATRALTVASSVPSADSTDIAVLSPNQIRVRSSVARTFVVSLNISNSYNHARASVRLTLAAS